ncbi:GntR family transcriptional regulator [Catellatospora sp. TT07R-123]|uniref:aminotransferase-like domain-containing protein n=1 Tax=Catellatospora sp. TT07R-123 TaxID=2733863 RepID=UPI001B209D60|nr:PLP-dependent aminotransferase family protein [Catellatospora sp. TT07R-123]GHJ45304.1 GntR family transcriptional regulator [Catellatospora sp. TT07R-123]
MVKLDRRRLHVSVTDPVAASMNFLNEVAGRYPDAVSLAAGRPYEGFYDTADIGRYLDRYVAYLAEQGSDPVQIRRALMQYGRTNGQIHGLIARMLATDDGIDVPAEAVSVTAGCQEAMVMVLRGLCAGPDDVLLAAEPCYVGITGAARILGIEVVPVPEGRGGLDPARVAETARAVRDSGRTPRALYLVPDFSNPSGLCLDVAARQGLLDVAEAEDFLILEDDPYGLFGLDDRPRPKLKALDTRQRVVYLGSFAKSVFPGARIGFLVADQTVVDEAGRTTLLAEELSTIKSMLTVNTSPIAQAVVGGVLVESGCSLKAANAQKIAFYRENLRGLVDALDRHLPAPWRDEVGVRWNQPEGGFFAVVDVPFTADERLLEVSASRYGVLWTPMSFFYTDGGTRSLRLSCSYLDAATVEEGVRRLAAMIRDNVAA